MHFIIKKLEAYILNQVPQQIIHITQVITITLKPDENSSIPPASIFQTPILPTYMDGRKLQITQFDRESNFLFPLIINLKKASTQCSEKTFHRCSRK